MGQFLKFFGSVDFFMYLCSSEKRTLEHNFIFKIPTLSLRGIPSTIINIRLIQSLINPLAVDITWRKMNWRGSRVFLFIKSTLWLRRLMNMKVNFSLDQAASKWDRCPLGNKVIHPCLLSPKKLIFYEITFFIFSNNTINFFRSSSQFIDSFKTSDIAVPQNFFGILSRKSVCIYLKMLHQIHKNCL